MRPRPRLALLAAAAWLAAAAGHGSAAEKAPDRAPAELRREVAQLRLERDVSAGKGFYLRLDVARQRLGLMLQGVTLDDYATSALEQGVPEVLFLNRAPKAGWDAAPITAGRLDPDRQRDRIEVVAPAPAATAHPGAAPTPSPPPLAKSAEETVSVPSPYRVVFAEGVSLEVRSRTAAARNRSWARRLIDALALRLSDLRSALGLGARERVRLRVTLADEDAAALYRSLPPDVGLVVVGLGPR